MKQRTLAWFIAASLFLGLLTPGALGQKLTLGDVPNPKVWTEGEVGRYGGTLVVGQISDPRTFNPIVTQETSSSIPLSYVFESLVTRNLDSLEIEPSLAESWSVAKDNKTWTFRLRRGVRWHDGKPLTADDVVFTWKVIFTPGVQTSARDVLTIAGKPVTVRKIDTYTVQFRTPDVFGTFLDALAGVPIVPKHKLEEAINKGGAEFNKTWGVNTPPRDLVGTGPFVMQQYIPGQRIVYLRNPNYWAVDKKGNRLPYLARFIILIVPNLEALRLKFQAREIDIHAFRPREYAEAKAGEKAGNYTIQERGPAAGTEFLVLNQNPKGIKPPKLNWFTNVKFRQAVSYAIDREAIANQIYGGRAAPQYGPVSPANKFYFNPKIRQYPRDLRRAESLLAEAGFKKGPDGVLRDPEGNPVEFVLSTNAENSERVGMGNIIRQDLAQLGMKVTFAPEAFNVLVGKLVGTFNWDAIIIGLTAGPEPTTGRNVWHSSGSLHMWNPKQEKPATDWEAEIDRLFDQAQTTIDPKKRKELYDRWQVIVSEQLPLIYLTTPLTQYAVRNTLGNVRRSPYDFGAIWNGEQVFYKQPYR
ncbi:MAG: ABC transporter substrate-binding protein [Armatimonadota bacterium]|nr:ABC transporter substrate-binding protein [Armatimonadota bacterium]